MAVYTNVSFDEADSLARALDLGPLEAMEGCKGGIENTNYFIDTRRGRYVLTVFERLGFDQLPYYLSLMKHLARHAIPVPDPAQDGNGVYLHALHGKPAAIVNRLPGSSALTPNDKHCAAVGDMLARMHLAAADFPNSQPNLRSLRWWNQTVPLVLPYLDTRRRSLLETELAYQNHVAASALYAALPRGAIHADLFRDNVLFSAGAEPGDAGEPQLSGFFDFYFAGTDCWLFDVAVALNDWCVDLHSGECDAGRSRAFLAAYGAVRALTGPERRLLPAMLRAGALRFWLSRLWDFHLPRAASLLKAHDPDHFERVLRQRVENVN